MSPDKEKYLFRKYRKLFEPAKVRHDCTKSCMAWGFEYADGWFELTENMLKEFMALDIKPIIAQAKEKFGGLRIYTYGTTDEIQAIITKYEQIADTTCEVCGKPGSVRGGRWLRALCDECDAK